MKRLLLALAMTLVLVVAAPVAAHEDGAGCDPGFEVCVEVFVGQGGEGVYLVVAEDVVLDPANGAVAVGPGCIGTNNRWRETTCHLH